MENLKVKGLTPFESMVVIRMIEAKSYREIAVELSKEFDRDITPLAVDNALLRARKKLAQKSNELGDHND